MRSNAVFALLFAFFISCNQRDRDVIEAPEVNTARTIDTLIARKMITNEIAGSAYRKRAIGYAVVVNADTSDFICIFSESKAGGKVSIDMHFQKVPMPYRQRMIELKQLLPEAEKDFNFDSLRSIYFGRLIQTGDLAIEVTRQFEQQFGSVESRVDYAEASAFLKKSKLRADIEKVFERYSIRVDDVSIEKLFPASKEELYRTSTVETDSSQVPDKILDCMTWVILKRVDQ